MSDLERTRRGAADNGVRAREARDDAEIIGIPCANTGPHEAHNWQMSATGYCRCLGVQSGREARDDEHEALVWDDARIREAFLDDGGQAAFYDPINGEREQRRIAGEIFDRWLAAHDAALLARQRPESEWEYGRLTIYSGKVLHELAVGDREDAERMVTDARKAEECEREHARFDYELVRRTKRVPAGPWVPVGEGERDADPS